MTVYVLNTSACITNEEPTSYEQARKSKDHHNWYAAMRDEMSALHKNQTWKETHRCEIGWL